MGVANIYIYYIIYYACHVSKTSYITKLSGPHLGCTLSGGSYRSVNKILLSIFRLVNLICDLFILCN